MKMTHVLSRTQSNESITTRRHVPWIASPLDHEAMSRAREEAPEEKRLNVSEQPVPSDYSHSHPIDTNVPTFKKHHESSTIELFYDLFFVANLSTFTKNHEVVDGPTLSSYIGFFTLMWFTWLQTSLFDVRFSSDSVLNRFFKAVSFGVMTGFAIVSSQYFPNNLDLDPEESFQNPNKSFRSLGLVLMVSRFVLAGQYGAVLWYVKGYKHTFRPLLSTMAVLLVSGLIFLGTQFDFPIGQNKHAYDAWYAISVVEAIAIIAVSCVWRVVSFKHTHLVERVGLLTLIVMGEGIIGMTGSVSTILQNTNAVNASAIGTIVASILLIYFIWVLYFDQIEHDRFGTIRQQVWALLHYPLHIAILLTVEGSTQFIIWNSIVNNINWLINNLWTFDNFPANTTTAAYVQSLSDNLTAFDYRFKSKEILDYYNFTLNLTAIGKLNLGDEKDLNESFFIIDDLFNGLTTFVFENYNVEVPADDEGLTTDTEKLNAFAGIFDTVFLYFLIAAGGLLIVLGVMYWFGKSRKSKWEFLSIVVRVLVGIGLTLVAISYNYNSGYNLIWSPWMIPMVVLIYFTVISIDNLLVWHSNKTLAHSLQYQRNQSESRSREQFQV